MSAACIYFIFSCISAFQSYVHTHTYTHARTHYLSTHLLSPSFTRKILNYSELCFCSWNTGSGQFTVGPVLNLYLFPSYKLSAPSCILLHQYLWDKGSCIKSSVNIVCDQPACITSEQHESHAVRDLSAVFIALSVSTRWGKRRSCPACTAHCVNFYT